MTEQPPKALDAPIDASAPPQVTPDPIFPFRFDWSLDNGFGSAEIGNGDGPVSLPAEIGKEKMTAWAIEPGFGLFDHGFKLKQRISVTGTKVIQQGVLFIRTGLTSPAICRRDGVEGFTENIGQYSLHLCQRPGDTCTVTYDQGDPAFGLAPIITEDRLRLMLEGRKVPALIERFLGGRGEDFAVNPRASLTMSRLAHEVRHNPYQGGMSDLFLQGKVHEMLAEAFKDLDEREAEERPIGPDHRRTMKVHDRLMADLLNPPSMEALARMAGLSQRRLNAVFQDVFGATVLEWLIDQRLALARDLLRQEELPIKEIAFRLGYARVNTFNSAFTRRYGVPPARYRQDRPVLIAAR